MTEVPGVAGAVAAPVPEEGSRPLRSGAFVCFAPFL